MNILSIFGGKIRYYRKKRKMTIEELATAIYKSVSTVSKYESGSIAMDILTLYDVAHALHVAPEELLYHVPATNAEVAEESKDDRIPSFFKGVTQFYTYYYDGRTKELVRGVGNIYSKEAPYVYNVMLYMNIESYECYQCCENTYHGVIKHYDALSMLELQNRDTPMDQYMISIPASYLNVDTRWALDFSTSSKPIMPIASKILVSRNIQEETEEFIKSLFLSKEDFKRAKFYNMFSVV